MAADEKDNRDDPSLRLAELLHCKAALEAALIQAVRERDDLRSAHEKDQLLISKVLSELDAVQSARCVPADAAAAIEGHLRQTTASWESDLNATSLRESQFHAEIASLNQDLENTRAAAASSLQF